MAIQSFVVPLFIPWLSRGVVRIQLPDESLVVDSPRPESETPEVQSDNSSERAVDAVVLPCDHGYHLDTQCHCVETSAVL
ncbi:uncharacterized protein B0H18DRAFT_1033375 [Fomitopsis serialis]|uniref:uncharacterized protein n=1 Tax=Fomitopsis serialis TaxID=139415 RepID=UPI0020072530|nr:uncharacterized protein B0H18DRAFT_1033375 [Neoantrodia serialis]KAH9917765.1 hypothetical protein B0H18DRAFT_1033375 [Neoantrodia serialis]